MPPFILHHWSGDNFHEGKYAESNKHPDLHLLLETKSGTNILRWNVNGGRGSTMARLIGLSFKNQCYFSPTTFSSYTIAVLSENYFINQSLCISFFASLSLWYLLLPVIRARLITKKPLLQLLLRQPLPLLLHRLR